MIWQTARGTIDLGTRGALMGIVNVTPDSFSDGGTYFGVESAVAHAVRLCEEGAAIIDVGGESTRPGSSPVSADEERRRILPVIEGLLARVPSCLVSVDTSKAEVARAALEAGAAIINDVTALQGDQQMGHLIARTGAGVVLMHMRGTPLTMQQKPFYGNVVNEVRNFLRERLKAAQESGIDLPRIAFDPGIGFGKDLEHNLTLLRQLPELRIEDRPLVLGVSRKSFLSKIAPATSMPERLWPTVALTALLRCHGARVLRVHDVRENLAALRTAEAMLGIA